MHEMSTGNVEKTHQLPDVPKRASSHESFKLFLQTIQTLALVGLVVVLGISAARLSQMEQILTGVQQILDAAIYNPEDLSGYIRVSSSSSIPVVVAQRVS